jgi:shikimate dehydrogenase
MTTQRFAVIGSAVAGSASPRMHAAAYAALGLDCTYDAVLASDRDLPGLVARLRSGELSGLNVTMPHKRRILERVDAVDSSARTVGAANTLVRDPNGRIVAYNTDVLAIAEELRRLAPDVPLTEGWMKSRALVLGTGATARSAIVALAHHLGVAEIVIRGRALENENSRDAFTAEITELLTRAGAMCALLMQPWVPDAAIDQRVLAVIQATNVGSQGGDPGEAAGDAVAWEAISPDGVALDVVYDPPVTPFLGAARAHGLRAANGKGMLARQGALAFELWFDQPAPFDVMLAAVSA